MQETFTQWNEKTRKVLHQDPNLDLPSPRTWATLHGAFKLAGNPSTVEVPLLRLDFLTIDVACPWHTIRVETKVILDLLESRSR